MKTWLNYVIADAPPDLQSKLRAAKIDATDSLWWRWMLTMMAGNYARTVGLELDDSVKKQVLTALRTVGSLLCDSICTGRWKESAATRTPSGVFSPR